MLTESLLRNLSENTERGRHTLAVRLPDAGWGVQVVAERADALASLVSELILTRTGDAPAGASLKDWAATIASRATGLLEPLKVHEIDDSRDEAVLRSAAPAKKGDALAYYEVRLNGLTSAVVRRYTASKTASGRTQVAFPVTHEAIAKLADDIAG